MNQQAITILIVDDEPDICELLKDILEDEGYSVMTANNASQADDIYQKQPIDLVLLDIWMPDEDGISLLKKWQQRGLTSEIIMMSGHGTIETAVQATKLGAFDFVEKPISTAKLLITIENVCKKIQLEKKHSALLNRLHPEIKIIGKSQAIAAVKTQLEKLAATSVPVSFWGQSGTGKRFYSRYLHQQTPERKYEPFITASTVGLNAAEQIEKLWGNKDQPGLIHQANGGSLYIDEISELAPETQVAFVRFIESGEHVHGDNLLSDTMDIRVCFASQYAPDTLLEQGDVHIREDFYHHISAMSVFLPTLQNYQDDIPELINHFVYEFVEKEELPFRQFSMQALNYLRQCPWVGNVRELKNFVQRALVLAESETIDLETVEQLMDLGSDFITEESASIPIDLPIREAREQFEKSYLLKQLKYCEGNIAKLSERSGLERTNLYRKLKSLGIQYK